MTVVAVAVIAVVAEVRRGMAELTGDERRTIVMPGTGIHMDSAAGSGSAVIGAAGSVGTAAGCRPVA